MLYYCHWLCSFSSSDVVQKTMTMLCVVFLILSDRNFLLSQANFPPCVILFLALSVPVKDISCLYQTCLALSQPLLLSASPLLSSYTPVIPCYCVVHDQTLHGNPSENDIYANIGVSSSWGYPSGIGNLKLNKTDRV